MNSVTLKISVFQIAFISIIALLVSGCGSSVENPAGPSDENSDELVADVKVSDKTVSPGEKVELTAEVSAVESNQLIFRWVNVTGYGTLSNTDKASTVWTAPVNLASGEVKVEVIHLVVTAISKIISVTDSKVNTDTEIRTATKTVLLTVKTINKLEISGLFIFCENRLKDSLTFRHQKLNRKAESREAEKPTKESNHTRKLHKRDCTDYHKIKITTN